jgi:ribosomal protein S18 acetylase RimI-like enzyme
MNASHLVVEPDMAAALEIIRHAGTWLRDTGKPNFSRWWDPGNVTPAALAPYTAPDDFYVVKIDGKPAATAILKTESTLQDWSSVDKDTPAPGAVYIFYVAVEREFAGHHLVDVLIDKAAEMARQHGFRYLRLDARVKAIKVCELYEKLGFERVGTIEEEGKLVAFYQKSLETYE